MTGKAVLAGILLASPLLAVAGGEVRPYAGIQVGDISGSTALYDASGKRQHFSNNGLNGGVFLGVGTIAWQHLWLGIEANGDFSSERTATQQIATAGGTSSARLRVRYTYGASFMPGLWFRQGMLYARAGILQSRFELKESSPPAGSNSSTDETLAGGAIYGAGVQVYLTGEWSVRAEYDRVIYRHFSSFGNRISPIDNQYRLGVLFDLS